MRLTGIKPSLQIQHSPGVASLLTITAFVCSLNINAVAQTDVELNDESCPVCTEEQIIRWQETYQSSLGVSAKDVFGHRIGLSEPYGYQEGPAFDDAVSIPKWRPFDREKQIMCGELRDFHIGDGGPESPEYDWSFKIRTDRSGPYRDKLAAASAQSDPDDVQEWSYGGRGAKGEITPDQDFFNKQFFFNVPDESAAASSDFHRTICMYGPWVADVQHHGIPEIHPAEMLWWVDANNPSIKYLMLLQDDSNRFDRPENFSISDEANWSRPWSAYPRWAEWRIAFKEDLFRASIGSEQHFSIQELYARRVITTDNDAARRDADDGDVHAILFNGRKVLQVTENQIDRHLGVSFVDVCRKKGEGIYPEETIIGFVALSSVIGEGDRGEEGYHVLRVNTAEPPFETSSDSTVVESIDARLPLRIGILPSSLRRSHSELVADLALQVPHDVTPPTVSVRTAQLRTKTGQKSLNTSNQAGVNVPLVVSAPVGKGGVVSFEFSTGEQQDQPLPELGITSSVRSETPNGVHEVPSAWPTFATAAGVDTSMHGFLRDLRGVVGWSLEIFPTYSPVIEGELSPEDGSVVGDALNAAIRTSGEQGGAERLQKLFGTSQPFNIIWSFSATNLRTKNSVPVTRAGPKQDEIGVIVGPGQYAGTKIDVKFPQTAHDLFRLDAVARVEDVYGIKGEFRHTFWSHFLAGQPSEALVDTLIAVATRMAKTAPESLAIARMIEEGQLHVYQAQVDRDRRAWVVRSVVLRAAQDQRITLRELGNIRRAATWFGSADR